MNAKEWREKAKAASEVAELTLPSGMVIKARRPGPLQFAQWDRLPLMLAAASGAGAASFGADQAKEIAGFMRELLVYCCIEPRVSETALEDSEEEIRPRDLPEQDWMFVVSWAMRLKEAQSIRPFRRERKNDGAGGDSEAVFVETERATGHRGPGAGAGDRLGGDAEGNRAEGERG